MAYFSTMDFFLNPARLIPAPFFRPHIDSTWTPSTELQVPEDAQVYEQDDDDDEVDDEFLAFLAKTEAFKRSRDAQLKADEQAHIEHDVQQEAERSFGIHSEEVRRLEGLLQSRYDSTSRQAVVWPAFPLKF